MSIASEITRINTNIANSYTAVDNKNGTLPATQNSANLASAIDSIEVIESATAEGESLSLTNTKAMPYSDYVVEGKSEQEGEPSPSNPSDIHSVADDVNLIDISSTSIRYGNISKEIVDNHLILTATGTSGSQIVENYVKNVDSSKNYTLSYKAKKIVKGTDGQSYIRIIVYGSNDNSTYTALQYIGEKNPTQGQEYFFTSNTFTGYKYYKFYIYNNSNTPVTIGEKTEYWDIKFQEGTVATPYSPYNQGTVTIKQEAVKNYLNWDKFIDYSNWTNSNSPGYKSFEITGLDINKTYTLCRTDTAGYGETAKYAGFNKGNNNGNMFLHSTDSSRNLQSVSDISSGDGKIYITMYMSSQSDLNAYINIIKKCWVIEDTEYQEYVNNNYTFQTAPLRSLPNGVKDTIEADGIHRRVGRVVLDGSDDEDWRIWSASLTNVERFYINIEGADIVNSLCDKFKYLPGNEDEEHYRDSTSGGRNKQFVIFINKSRLSEVSINGLKQYLQDNPIKLLYKLAEEIIEPLTQNQATTMLDIIKRGSYEGTTNLYTDEDVKPTMKVDYYKKK